jgi:hypothetical protein
MEWVVATTEGSVLRTETPVSRAIRRHGRIDTLSVDVTGSRDIALEGPMLGAVAPD